MRYWLFMLLLGLAGTGIASQEDETSPCQGLVSVHDTNQFEEFLIVTDEVFSSIEDCEMLAAFYNLEESDRSRVAFDFSSVDDIVNATWQPVNEDSSFLFMDAVLSWLKNLGFEKHADTVQDFFTDYMPSKESVELFFIIFICLIVLAVVFLVLREFYLAGMLRLPHFSKRPNTRIEKHSEPVLQWRQVLSLPIREQISALLRYSIECLVASNVIPASKSYTNRELKAHLLQSDPIKARLFQEQIQLTEPILYGDEAATDEMLKACQLKAQGICDA